MTRLDVPVTYNFRPVAATRAGTLYRADALAKLNRQGRARLTELGVVRVIDLRSDLDRRLAGQDRLTGTGIDLVKVPMLAGNTLGALYEMTLESVYRDLLDSSKEQLGRTLRAVADAPEGAVVVHCTAGKDRTGIVSALIQLALGVDEDAVIADYALTQGHLEGEWKDRVLRKMRRFGVTVTPEITRIFAASPPEALASALEHLRWAHGGAEAYIAEVGITDEHIERLHRRLA